MKAKRIKATHAQDQAWWLGDHFILPADAASYERMVRQMTRPWMTRRYQTTPEMIRASLRAIGITPPRAGKGRK